MSFVAKICFNFMFVGLFTDPKHRLNSQFHLLLFSFYFFFAPFVFTFGQFWQLSGRRNETKRKNELAIVLVNEITWSQNKNTSTHPRGVMYSLFFCGVYIQRAALCCACRKNNRAYIYIRIGQQAQFNTQMSCVLQCYRRERWCHPRYAIFFGIFFFFTQLFGFGAIATKNIYVYIFVNPFDFKEWDKRKVVPILIEHRTCPKCISHKSNSPHRFDEGKRKKKSSLNTFIQISAPFQM